MIIYILCTVSQYVYYDVIPTQGLAIALRAVCTAGVLWRIAHVPDTKWTYACVE